MSTMIQWDTTTRRYPQASAPSSVMNPVSFGGIAAIVLAITVAAMNFTGRALSANAVMSIVKATVAFTGRVLSISTIIAIARASLVITGRGATLLATSSWPSPWPR